MAAILISAAIFIFPGLLKQLTGRGLKLQSQAVAENQNSLSTTSAAVLSGEVEADRAVQAEPELPDPLEEIVSKTVPDPVTLRIPSVGLLAPIVKTGLEEDGSLHVPGSPNQTGWYTLGPKPGSPGPAVITGHYDSKSGPGALYNLKKVKPGSEIEVVRNDGSVAVFTVDKLEQYPQDNFATKAVYTSNGVAALRLITCAGTYNNAAKRYSDNLVVYATLKEIRQPEAYIAK